MIHIMEMLIIIYMIILGVVAMLKVFGFVIASWIGVMAAALCVEAGLFLVVAVLAFLLEVIDD